MILPWSGLTWRLSNRMSQVLSLPTVYVLRCSNANVNSELIVSWSSRVKRYKQLTDLTVYGPDCCEQPHRAAKGEVAVAVETEMDG